MTPALYRLRRRRQELPDTVTLELEPADGRPCLEYAPGQFTMLYVPGVGEVPISISGHHAGALVQTVRDVGAVTRALTHLPRGAPVGVRGPFGRPWPTPVADEELVVVAGGLGLAPLRPVLRSTERLRLLYGARTPADLLFPEELKRWRSAFPVDVTVDAADRSWTGHVGVVTHLVARLELRPERTLALVCGPEIMMRFAAEALLAQGLPPERIYLSLERNMRCAVGTCGHCQLGPVLVCRDGPVFGYDRLAPLLKVREL